MFSPVPRVRIRDTRVPRSASRDWLHVPRGDGPDHEEAQLRALGDAAWLADLAGDDAGFELRLGKVELLLDTHDIPGARYKMRTMLLKDFTAFAPHLESW